MCQNGHEDFQSYSRVRVSLRNCLILNNTVATASRAGVCWNGLSVLELGRVWPTAFNSSPHPLRGDEFAIAACTSRSGLVLPRDANHDRTDTVSFGISGRRSNDPKSSLNGEEGSVSSAKGPREPRLHSS